ncbi:hypothetical protein I4F81_006995 [Pyropia yezoensis]|uniref:Uncharacterized protein n=1 Tax=Pyropia yezoensis TaxID=2788 RepID=A0ACC3C2U4_PYRYE|nr:hypothetical protein I4F81_006995 [Neopyropia yezoensis]
MRFRDASSKFSGNLREAWMEYVAEYQQVGRDYDLSQEQRFQYMHNILSGDAKRFYLDKVQSYATSFSQAVDMVSTEYNSIVRQNRAKNYLVGYRMSTLLSDGVTEAAALEQAYKTITKLTPQVPRSNQGDAHQVDFLRNAVVGSPWATEPLSRIATHGLTFHQLYVELEAALHLHKVARLEAMRTPREGMRRTVARARLREALRMRVPQVADADVAAGMAVLVFREKPVNSWVGPYTVIKANGKLVWIEVDGTAKLFSVDEVKQYRHSAVPGAKRGESDQISPDGSDNAAPPRPEDGELSVRKVGDKELDQLMEAKRTGAQLLTSFHRRAC